MFSMPALQRFSPSPAGPALARVATPPATQAACSRLLDTILTAQPGVLAAVVGSADGRAYAHGCQPGQRVDAPRIAAIASSLLALSESFSGEALRSRAEYNSIATPHGTIVIVRVPSAARAHVLCLWADQSENFAMTLRVALDSASRLAPLIDAA